MKQLIHFVDLDELVEELLELTPVRICTLMDESRTAYISVRQIQGEMILMWSYVVGKYEANEQVDEVAEHARFMEETVWNYLDELDVPCLNVRPGIIDIEDRMPMFGIWRHWEEQHQDEEE